MNAITLQGKTEKTIGHIKQAAGDLTGDNRLQTEGVRDQAVGQAHEIVGAVKQIGRDIRAGVADGKAAAKRDV